MDSLRILLFILALISSCLSLEGKDHSFIDEPEKLFLHTDRSVYVSGQNLYYSLFISGEAGNVSRYAYLVLRNTESIAVYNARLDIRDGRSYGSIPLADTLKTGFYEVLCFTNSMRNNEESIFRKEIIIANRFDDKPEKLFEITHSEGGAGSPPVKNVTYTDDENLVVGLNSDSFGARERISVTIEAPGDLSDPVSSVSISVCEMAPGICDGPVITSHFRALKKNRLAVSSVSDHYSFIPEINGQVLQGRISGEMMSDTGTGGKEGILKGVEVYLSAADTVANLLFALSDSAGFFHFLMNPYYERRDVYIRTAEKVNGIISLDLKNNIDQPFLPYVPDERNALKEFILRSEKVARVNRYYGNFTRLDTLRLPDRKSTLPRVYYKEYLRIVPSEYLELPDFTEIAREILPYFRIRRDEKTFSSSFSNLLYQRDTDDAPLIFLDGVPVDGVQQLLMLGSRDIKTIELVPAVRYYNRLIFNGFMSVVSVGNAIADIQFESPSVRFSCLPCLPFTRPAEQINDSIPEHYPDLRQLLLWEPDLKPDANGAMSAEFAASDLGGTYRVSVTGITMNGNPLSGTKVFTVKPKE